jgi:hypothetical protein
MKNQRTIRFMGSLLLAAVFSGNAAAAAEPGPDAPNAVVGEKAGKITALLPTAHVIRGEGKNAVSADARKGDELVWQDLIKTDKGGRARITLNDQSILSLGSQAELRIVKHDAKAQQTILEMTYGRIRTQVENVTRNGGSFQLKTSTAVAGVIGTDFGTDASEPGVTTFICIAGLVQVGNADPTVPGSVPCTAGQTTTVKSGLPPTPPKPASQQQIQQIVLDTEPATISAFTPASALIGSTVDAVATGTHFSGINGLNVSGSGIRGSLAGNSTATSATAHLVIAANAQAGPRTVTFTKPNGANAAALFTVIVPGAIQGTDATSLKRRYLDIIDVELQASQAADNATKSSLQQEIDAALGLIQQNNSKLPRPLSTDQVQQQLQALITTFSNSGNLSGRESRAYATTSAEIDKIVAQAVIRLQSGAQQQASLASDLDKQFAPVNQAFEAALGEIHTEFTTQAATQLAGIQQIVSSFEQALTAAAQQQLPSPTPKVDSEEKTVEAGFEASFDASASTAIAGTTLTNTAWVLCDPSYRPGQVGVPLPGDTPGCRAVPGFASSGSEFQVNTCSLAPADYTARLTVTDSNARSTATDVRLHVLPPAYDDPATRLRNLAGAYTTLQQQQFLSYFDPTYAGYTELQENVRNTFLNLASMRINLRISQTNITCNDASLRADWEQIYTFRSDETCSNAAAGQSCQRVVFRQAEQLTARMTRIPGKGWFISDLQGDNGTVQGVPPGPQTTFVAQPNLQVTGLTLGNQQPQSKVLARSGVRASANNATQTPVGLAAGTNFFIATVTNIGNAPLTQQPQLRISLLDADNNELIGTTENLAVLPLKPGDSEMVTGTIIVPSLPPNVPLSVSATVNPGCKVQEQTCGSKDIAFLPATSGVPSLLIANVKATGQLVGTQTGILSVTITNSGTATSLAGTLALTSPDFQGALATITVPPVAPGQSLTIDVPFSVPNSPGQHSVVVTVNQPSTTGGGGSVTQTLNIVQGTVDLQVGALSLTAGVPPFTAGENHTVSFNIGNKGDVSSNSADTFTCRLTNGGASAVLGSGILPIIAAGSTSSPVALTFTVPASTPAINFGGASNIVCAVSQDSLESASQIADDSASISAFINAPAYAIGSIVSATTPNPATGANAFQVGQSLDLQVAVANTGTASPTGNIVVQLNCNAPCSFSTPAPTATVAAPAGGKATIADFVINNLNVAPAAGYTATASIVSAPAQGSTANNSASVNFDVTDFTLSSASGLTGGLNVRLGSTGIFNVSLSEPQGLSAMSIPVSVGPSVSGVNYALQSPLSSGSTQPVVITATSSAPAATSALVAVTGTRFGVSRSATQPVRFYTASLDNFSPGQPGNNPNIPIVLPVGGTAQSLQIRMSGSFSAPSGGAQLVFPAITGISFTPSATIAAPGDVIALQISAVQGAAVNQTIPISLSAQIPNTNPQDSVSLLFYVRPTALPDLSVTAITVGGRNFSTNPWLSGEPLDFVATVSNNGQGASQGFEGLHLRLNGAELTQRGTAVPQAIAPNSSISVTLHVVAPDPAPSGAASLTVSVDEDATGDANPNNDSLGLSGVITSDWSLAVSGAGSSDTQSLVVPAGGSLVAAIVPTITAGGNFLTPIPLVNGVLSSRITASPNVGAITNTRPISYSVSAGSNAADGFYVTQLIARFVDFGRNTAQRAATVHVQVANPIIPAAPIAVAVDRGNACSSGCTPIQINGLLVENENITVSRSSGPLTSVDLHFSDPANIVSDVTQSGSFQTPIINGVQNGVPNNVYFAAAQDSAGAVLPGPAAVIVSATSIQTSSRRDGPTPDPVGPSQTILQFSIGDLQLAAVPCFNVAPGAEGVLTLNFSAIGGFNAPNISWSVASVPPGIVLNSVTAASSFSGGGYSPVSIDLSNNNPADVTPDQPITLVGTISNANGSATVAFAPTVQMHSGACIPGGVRNARIEGASLAAGPRGFWRRGASAAFIARSHVVRQQPTTSDVRLLAGDVSYTPAMPKTGDTIQVRFRISNNTGADAPGVPVALLIDNNIVASDTFDVPAGRTVLGGLQWPNATLPRMTNASGLIAALVIDPTRNSGASPASGKVARLPHFSLAGAASNGMPIQAGLGGRQRARIQLTQTGCAGFSFNSGVTATCTGSDVEFALEDAASGRFALSSNRGIADAGAEYNRTSAPATPSGTQVPAVIGHSYAVQLSGGRIGILTLRAVSNPHRRAVLADRTFRGGAAAKAAARLGRGNGPVETGDVSGAATRGDVLAVIDVLYDLP